MNNKVKAIIFSAITTTIIIAAIVTIALWPTQQNNNQNQGDKGDSDDKNDHSDGDNTDNSRFNFLNLHYRISNHTLISTTTTVVFGCLILTFLLAKGYASRQKRRKRDNTRTRDRERNPYTRDYATNGTWTSGSMGPTDSWSTPAPTWGHPQPQGQMIPGGHHHPYGPQPLPAPRVPREEGQELALRGAGQELALVHSDATRANNENGPKMGSQWKHNN